MVRENQLVSKRTGETEPVTGYRLPGGGKIFPRAGFDNNQWKAQYQPNLDKHDYDIAKSYTQAAVKGPAFKRFFEGKSGGKFPVAVLDPKTQKKMGVESRTIYLSDQTRDAHPRITLKHYRDIQKTIDSTDPIYLPDNRAGYVFTEGGKLKRLILKATRDKKELYFLSRHTTRKGTVEKMKKREK